mgnify:CR=1 FL=1
MTLNELKHLAADKAGNYTSNLTAALSAANYADNVAAACRDHDPIGMEEEIEILDLLNRKLVWEVLSALQMVAAADRMSKAGLVFDRAELVRQADALASDTLAANALCEECEATIDTVHPDCSAEDVFDPGPINDIPSEREAY